MRRTLAFVILISVSLGACFYDNEEDLYGGAQCGTQDMSYSKDIVPILEANTCLSCHSAQAKLGNIDLSTYSNVSIYVKNGSLLGSMRHDAGYSPMPQAADKVNNCNLNKVQAWIDQGAKDN